MIEKLRSFFSGLLFLLKDTHGTVASMVPMTGDTTSDPTSLDYARPEIWEQRLRFNAARKSFFGPLKGKELSGKPIIEREDFVNQAGDVIHINVMSESFGPGITGENTLRGNEDALSLGQFNLSVDWLRKAFALTKKIKKQVNFDMLQQVRVRAENWLARELDANVFAELLADVTDTLYAGNATSEATLSDDDTFTTQELDKIKLALDRIGALPITVEREGGQETFHYACVISEVDEYNLRGDDRWLDACKYAQIRGDKNPIFTGRPVEWNGLLVYTLRGVKSAGCLQGSPLRPETKLYSGGAGAAEATLNASDTTIYVGGASESNAGRQKDYTKFFAQTTGTITIGTEEISYTGTSYRSFTGCTRGENSTTAATHAAGSLITQRHVSTVIGFGAEICAFGWGQHPQRIEDTDDYGFITGIGIETLYGVQSIKDSDGNTPNFLLMKAYSKNPGSI